MKQRQFDELVTSIKQAGKTRRKEAKPSRVHAFSPPDFKTVRLQIGHTQVEFAMMIGVSVATLRNWERGRRTSEEEAMPNTPPTARPARLKVGDRVRFSFGIRRLTGVIIEDRGLLAAGKRRLYGVRFRIDLGREAVIELPEDEVQPV